MGQRPLTANILQRDVSVRLNRNGVVLVAKGELAAARARYEESLRISQILVPVAPSSATVQRDVWASMWRLQRFPESGITWTRIVAAMESMQPRCAVPDGHPVAGSSTRQCCAGETLRTSTDCKSPRGKQHLKEFLAFEP
jgi:hypothetical protein